MENEESGSKNQLNKRPGLPKRTTRRPLEFLAYLTSLNVMLTKVLIAIEGRQFIKWPKKMKTYPDKRDKTKYCRFLRNQRQDIEQCKHLRVEIE